MKEGDRERAFHAAHMLKGVSANLGLNRLLQTVSLLTELLQTEATAIPNEAYLFFEEVKQEYAFSVSTIRAYLNSDQA